jgi:hypothetical protein
MTNGALIWIRVVLAFAIGVGMVLIGWANYLIAIYKLAWLEPIGINVAWLELLLPFLCSFALCFKWRPLRGGSPTPGNWLVDLDSSGLLIPLVIVIGLNIAQTIVLIWDTLIGPPTDSLLPADYSLLLFEYIMSTLKVGFPALAGSMLARAMSWAVNRVRVQ